MLTVEEIKQLAARAADGNRVSIRMFRELAVAVGIEGRPGGWIYLPEGRRPVGHGWKTAAGVFAVSYGWTAKSLIVDMSKASCSAADIARDERAAYAEDFERTCDCDGTHAPTEGGHSVACRRRERLGVDGLLYGEPTLDEQHAEALLMNEARGAWTVAYDGEGGTVPAVMDAAGRLSMIVTPSGAAKIAAVVERNRRGSSAVAQLDPADIVDDRGMHMGPGHVAPATIERARAEALAEDAQRDAMAGRPVPVVFERVARTWGVSLLVERELLDDPNGFAYAVHKGVRGYIASKTFEVEVDVERGVVLLEGGRFGRGSFPAPPPVMPTVDGIRGHRVTTPPEDEQMRTIALSGGLISPESVAALRSAPHADRLERAFAEFTKLADSGGPGTARGLVAAVESATTISAADYEAALDRAIVAGQVVYRGDVRNVLELLGFKIS